MCHRGAAVEDKIDECGEDHAHDGGSHGERDLAQVAQLATDELPLELQSYDKEEHGHQAVVDPVLKREVEAGLTIHDKAEVVVEEVGIISS